MDTEKRLREQLAQQKRQIAQLRPDTPLPKQVVDRQASVLSASATIVAEFQLLVNQWIPNDYCLLFSESTTKYLLVADSTDNRVGLLPDERRLCFPSLLLQEQLNVADMQALPAWTVEYSTEWPLLRSALIQPIVTEHQRYVLLLGSSRLDAFEGHQTELFGSFAVFATKIIAYIEERAQQENYERSLQQSEKMISLGQLAAGVAHEINNPLGFVFSNFKTLSDYVNSLRSYITGLEQCLSEPNETRRKDTLLFLKRENNLDYILADFTDLMMETEVGLERIKDIVSSLRSYSQPDTGEMVRLDLREVMSAAQKIVLGDLKYKAVVEYDTATQPIWVQAKSSRLNQVFANLIINAFQSINHDSGKVKIKIEERQGKAVVTISDNGIGIPQEHLNRIFEPFFTTREIGDGSGLGLSVTKAIVEEHGGRMTVRSEVDRGTSVRVIFPAVSRVES